jgi:hypothetical protein
LNKGIGDSSRVLPGPSSLGNKIIFISNEMNTIHFIGMIKSWYNTSNNVYKVNVGVIFFKIK